MFNTPGWRTKDRFLVQNSQSLHKYCIEDFTWILWQFLIIAIYLLVPIVYFIVDIVH